MNNLREYQKKGAAYLYSRKKAILIMGCRTGKTKTALLACDLVNKEEKMPVYIVAPPATRKMWMTEDSDYTFERTFLSPFLKGNHKIIKDSIIIIDECQLYLHDWSMQQTIIRMCLKAKYCFMLTATPLINNPINLYWPLKICGKVMSKNDYKLKFMDGKWHRYKKNFVYPTGVSNLDELKRLKESVSFSYFRQENVAIEKVNLGPCPLSTPDAIEDYSNMMHTISVAKVERIMSSPVFRMLLVNDGLKVVFFRHTEAGKLLKHALLKNYSNITGKVFYIDGSVNFKEREKIISDFESNKRAVLLLSVESSGIGIDISKPSVVMFFERTWSPFKDYQAYMRCYGFDPSEKLSVWYFDYEDEAKLLVNKEKEVLKSV